MIIDLTSPNFAAIVTGLGVCIIDALEQTPAGAPTRQCLLVPTQLIPWDNCDCGGQYAAAIQQTYGSDSPPQPLVTTWVKCSSHWTLAQVLFSVTRCVPTLDEQGRPPPCDAELAAALTLENDRTAVRQALMCCLTELYAAIPPEIGFWSLGPSVTVGELGGCAGVETTAIIGVRTGCGC